VNELAIVLLGAITVARLLNEFIGELSRLVRRIQGLVLMLRK